MGKAQRLSLDYPLFKDDQDDTDQGLGSVKDFFYGALV